MTAAQDLAGALLALVPDDLTLYDGHVPASPTYPYVYALVTLPAAASRAMSTDVHGRLVRAQFTVVAGTADGVRIVAGLLDAALDGARPAADSYSFGRVKLRNARPTEEDRTVTVPATNRPAMYAVLEYEFVASTTG